MQIQERKLLVDPKDIKELDKHFCGDHKMSWIAAGHLDALRQYLQGNPGISVESAAHSEEVLENYGIILKD